MFIKRESMNQTGVLMIKTTKAFGESTASKIIDLVENASSRKAPTENFITTFARYYTPVVVILAAFLAILPPIILGGGWTEWIRRGFVFLVVSCPCALVISIPLTFFGGIGAASKRGVLVKGSNYLEALNNVSVIVFAGFSVDLKEYSNTMMLSRVVSGKYDVFLASDDFIDVTTLTQMDYMIMDSEEMR